MAVRLTPLSKVLIILALAGGGYGAMKLMGGKAGEELIPGARTQEGMVPQKAELPTLNQAGGSGVEALPLPGAEAGCQDKPEVRFFHWAWNAQAGMMFATGGKQATQGSLMCQNGVNLKLVREDDVGKMQENLVSFATALSKGEANPKEGAHFVAIMGDGAASFLQGLNETLEKLGPEYRAKVVGSAGYSKGEDKFMGPSTWKQNPNASRGGLVSGYLRDGDWNIAQKWLGDNGLCNNPDEKTWDPSCLNWVAANDYLDAAEKYISGYCEDRPVVKKGKRTGEQKKVCVEGVVTWTPGDVNVAQKKGGLVSIVSTREYAAQMPNTIIGIDKWMQANRSTVEGMLSAIFTAGDQIKTHPSALRKAAEISAQVYNEETADYWVKYFNVVVEKDKQGLDVELGGSSVNNLADNLYTFGMMPGSANLFGTTYTVFAEIVKQQYPDLMPRYDSVRQILDTSYVKALADRAAPQTKADIPTFQAEEKIKAVVSRKAWQINFDSGKASFTPDATGVLEQLSRDLLVASNAMVEIHGHTDAQGKPEANMALSEERAFAVKQWLEQTSPANFPTGRLRVFAHGQENPLAPNSSPAGRAQNRRVEIVLGTGL